MTERPIIFSSPMVCAILAGRKTQTRRVVKWQGPKGYQHSFDHAKVDNPAGAQRLLVPFNHPSEHGDPWWQNGAHRHYCPHGDATDRLWVKETFAKRQDCADDTDKARHYLMFRADGGNPRDSMNWHDYGSRWTSSRFMPRWASRLTLEITSVRVERLQDISEEDAKKEGCEPHISAASGIDVPWWQGYREFNGDLIYQQHRGDSPPEWMIEPKRMKEWPHLNQDAKRVFEILWETINAKRAPWSSNPWVWVIEFERVKK